MELLSKYVEFKNGKKRPDSKGSIPVYGGNGILDYTNVSNMNKGVVIGRVGVYCGSVFLVKDECWVSDNAIKAMCYENMDLSYLYYLLSSLQLNERRIGTSQPLLTQNILNNIEVDVPALDKQKKIASILESLDKKIQLNNEINNNLEQQAKTIFDNMFPNISNGSCAIGDYITPKRGKSLLSKNAIFGNIPVIAGGLEPSTYHNVANTQSPVLAISASGANAGYVSLWNIPIWSSDSSYIDSSMTDDVYFWYVLLKKRQKEIFDAQTGSAQPHIYPQHIASMSVSNLDIEEVHSYTSIVTPIFEIIGHHKEENTRLASLRDTLLPKLMSGELDVSNIEI